jgi:hypothetical protein
MRVRSELFTADKVMKILSIYELLQLDEIL